MIIMYMYYMLCISIVVIGTTNVFIHTIHVILYNKYIAEIYTSLCGKIEFDKILIYPSELRTTTFCQFYLNRSIYSKISLLGHTPFIVLIHLK